jgi:hypothetical protein
MADTHKLACSVACPVAAAACSVAEHATADRICTSMANTHSFVLGWTLNRASIDPLEAEGLIH